MRISRLGLSGFKAYPSPVVLDVSTLPGVVTAVTGPNGAGKTTLLEAMHGAVHRAGRLPTRGSLADIAAARDAYVEVDTEVGGRGVRIRQTIDGQSGKGKALVLDMETGKPVDGCASGGLREYSAWAKSRLPDEDVVLSSTFLSQGPQGLLAMTDGERVGVILRALGSERLERLSKGARERAKAIETKLTAHVAKLAAIRDEAGDVATTEATLSAARVAHQHAITEFQDAQKGADAAREALVAYEEAQRVAAAVAADRAAVQDRLSSATELLYEIDRCMSEAEVVVIQAASIRAAVESAAVLDSRLRELPAARDVAERDRDTAAREASRYEEDARAADRRVAAAIERVNTRRRQLIALTDETKRNDLQTRIANNRRLLADRDAIESALAQLAELDTETATLRENVAGLIAAIDASHLRASAIRKSTSQAYERYNAAAAKKSDAERRAADADKVKAAGNQIPGAEDALSKSKAKLADVEQRRENLLQERGTGIEGRHAALLSFVRLVASADRPLREEAAATLKSDDDAAKRVATLPERIATADAARKRAVDVVSEAQETLDSLRALAPRPSQAPCQT